VVGFRNRQNVGGPGVLHSAYQPNGGKDEMERPSHTSEGTVGTHHPAFFSQRDGEEPAEGRRGVLLPISTSMTGGCRGEELQSGARQWLWAAEVSQAGYCWDAWPPCNL